MSEHKYPMRTVLVAVIAFLAVGFQRPSTSDGDVIVPVTISRSPMHFERFDDDEDEFFTVVTDFWELDSVEFPSLEGTAGEIILQVRTPNGEQLMVEQYPQFAFEIQFGSILSWATDTGGSQIGNSLRLEPAFSFIGESGIPPSSFRTLRANFSPDNSSVPPLMDGLEVSINSLDAPGGWGFEGFDFSMPISDVLEHFSSTPVQPPMNFAISFEYLVPGNAVGTADADQFTSLVPEPVAFVLLLLGIMATPLLRHRPQV